MSYKREIYEVLRELGLPANLLGYHYITDMIQRYLNGEYEIEAKFTDHYKDLANEYNTSNCAVERAMRHCIRKCCDHTDSDILYKYFGNCFGDCYNKKTLRITNAEFVFSVAEYIRVYVLK